MARSETCLIGNYILLFSALCNLVKRTDSALGKESWVILPLSLAFGFSLETFRLGFCLDFAYLWDLLRLESKTEWLQWNHYRFHLHPALSQREINRVIQAVCISQVRDHWDQSLSEIPLVRTGYRQWQIIFPKISKLLFLGMKIFDPLLVSRRVLSFFYSNIHHWSFSFSQAACSYPSKKIWAPVLQSSGCTCPCTGAAWQWDLPPIALCKGDPTCL